MDFTRNKPIVACSTGLDQNAAIGVIRLSGFNNFSVLGDFFSKSGPIEPRKSYLSTLIDPKSNQALDEVVFVYFEGPNSFTGENVLEISAHGNALNIQRIINNFVDNGFDLAEPGEFTFRALKNNKMTLSQVEGLDLFLNSKSTSVLDSAFECMSGGLHKEYLALHDRYLNLKSAVEMNIDFVEDIGEENAQNHLEKGFSELLKGMKSLYERCLVDTQALLSPDIVFVGQPNAGKSSFFNFLLGSDRAIVSDVAGTTRDYISEVLNVDGTQFRLVDTAGLRHTEDAIEKEGVKRTEEQLENAFLKVAVVNPLESLDPSVFGDVDYDLLVLTHGDKLSGPIEPVGLNYRNYTALSNIVSGEDSSGPIGPAIVISGPIGPNSISGPIGPANSDEILSFFKGKYLKLLEKDPLLVPRQREKIKAIYTELTSLRCLMESESDIAIISSEVSRIGQLIEDLIGYLPPDAVLGNIFENFCIGK